MPVAYDLFFNFLYRNLKVRDNCPHKNCQNYRSNYKYLNLQFQGQSAIFQSMICWQQFLFQYPNSQIPISLFDLFLISSIHFNKKYKNYKNSARSNHFIVPTNLICNFSMANF